MCHIFDIPKSSRKTVHLEPEENHTHLAALSLQTNGQDVTLLLSCLQLKLCRLCVQLIEGIWCFPGLPAAP